MSEDTLSKKEFALGLLLIAVIITTIQVVSHFVLKGFWALVFKLIETIWPEKQ